MRRRKGTPFYSGGNNPVAPHQPAPHRAVLPLRGGRYYCQDNGTAAPASGTAALRRLSREQTQMRYYHGGRVVLPLLERYYRPYNRD